MFLCVQIKLFGKLALLYLSRVFTYNFQIGQDQKVLFAGNSLNDDIYHTVIFRRRGSKLRAIVDDDDPILGICQVVMNRIIQLEIKY